MTEIFAFADQHPFMATVWVFIGALACLWFRPFTIVHSSSCDCERAKSNDSNE